MFEKIFFNSSENNSSELEMRSGWQVLIFLVLAIIAIIMMSAIGSLLPLNPLLNNPKTFLIPVTIAAICNLSGALIASWLCVWRLAHRPFASLGYALHQGWIRDFGFGLLLALLMVSLIALLQYASGGTRFNYHLDTHASEILRGLIFPLILVFTAASFEEVLFRGFPMQQLAKGTTPLIAALLTSLPFGIAHLNNPSANIFSTINTVLAGLWLAQAYFKTRNLWFATGVHMGWNYTLGIYGLPISGIKFLVPNPILLASEKKYTWLTGGEYGPEGGASATIILILGMLWIYQTDLLKVSYEMSRYFIKKSDDIDVEPLIEQHKEVFEHNEMKESLPVQSNNKTDSSSN